MIVRELLAKLGLDVDKASFDRGDQRISNVKKNASTIGKSVKDVSGPVKDANKNINKTKQSLGDLQTKVGDVARSVGGFLAAGALLAGGQRLITFASDANETLNVLDASFKHNTDSVLQWADTFGSAAGRSEYQMRELAGQLGAVLNPMMDYNADAAAKMSTRLTELAVDLGSFYNATDDEALNALRSGIVGETEPLKRFGIVMLEANLAAFAMEKGITKNIKSMTIAEKTQLRYNFLLDKTKLAHGDAAKTSQGFANASKGLLGGLRDLATTIGAKILPGIEKFIGVARDLVSGFNDLVEGSKIVEAVLIALGVAGSAAGLKMAAAWLPAILPFLKIAVVVGALVLVIEDFLTFLDGGQSVIGRFIDSIWGPGSAAEAARFLREDIKAFQDFLAKVVFPFWAETFPNAISSFIEGAKQGFTDFKNFVSDAFDSVVDTISSAIDKALGYLDKVNTFLSNTFGIDIKAYLEETKAEIRKEQGQVGRLKTKKDVIKSGRVGPVSRAPELPPSLRVIPNIRGAAKLAGSVNTFNQSIDITLKSDQPKQDVSKLVREVSRRTKDINKKTLRALSQATD